MYIIKYVINTAFYFSMFSVVPLKIFKQFIHNKCNFQDCLFHNFSSLNSNSIYILNYSNFSDTLLYGSAQNRVKCSCSRSECLGEQYEFMVVVA